MCVLGQERRYHSASVVDQKLLVFGGQYYDAAADLHFECDNAASAARHASNAGASKTQFAARAQVCIYDLHTGHWSALSVDAATPLRRACHAAGVVGQKVLIIGESTCTTPSNAWQSTSDVAFSI